MEHGIAGEESVLSGALHVLKQAVDATSSGIAITDPHLPDNPIIYHNATFERLTGYESHEITGRNCRFLQGPNTDPAAVALLRVALREQTDCQVILQNYRKDGSPFWNELYLSPVFDPRTGSLTHFVGVQNDITARIDAEKERDALLARQKRVADTLQLTLLAAPAPDAFPGLRVHTIYEAAWEEASIGGDFFDAFALDGHKVVFIVGDVTGKGLSAAAYTGQIKFALRVFLREHSDPSRALERLNQFLFMAQRLDNLSQYALASAHIIIVDTQTGQAVGATAGAEGLVVLRAASETCETVDMDGPLLAVVPDALYPPTGFALHAGDTLLLFTDGLTEARRKRREMFGVEGVVRAACAAYHTAPSLPELGQAIIEAAQTFAGGRLGDDACMLLIRRDAASG